MTLLLTKVIEFQENELLTRDDLLRILGDVIRTLTVKPSPEKLTKHADIVKECTRLLARDKYWHKALESNKARAKVFALDNLICSKEPNVSKIGITMGAVLVSRVSNVEL
jgi:hypothetical protein